MHPLKVFLPIILALMVAIGVVIEIADHAPVSSDGRVYSYPVLVDLLRRHPGDVLGRAIRLRAQAEDTNHQPGPAMRLADPAGALGPLALHADPENPLLALTRRLPVLGRLVPAPQRLDLDQPAVYRVLLERGRGWDCLFMPTPCFAAVLLGAYQVPE
jgi:hypothetical protein